MCSVILAKCAPVARSGSGIEAILVLEFEVVPLRAMMV